VNGEIPNELSRIIDWLLEKKPSRRPATALQVKEALARSLASLQQRGWRPRRLSQRVPRLAIAASPEIIGEHRPASIGRREQLDQRHQTNQ
jgi:hypothetical protein